MSIYVHWCGEFGADGPLPATNKKCVAELINTIDNGQSHKMRRYRHWLRDLREDCEELQATRESFRSELWSLRSV